MIFSRNKKYEEWIMKNYPTPDLAFRKCYEACLKMKQVFPELDIIRGQIEVEEPDGWIPTKTTHWWCKYKDIIVDPTKHQYPTRILCYKPIDESKGDPTGKCLNCGNLTYNCEHFCCESCEKSCIC